MKEKIQKFCCDESCSHKDWLAEKSNYITEGCVRAQEIVHDNTKSMKDRLEEISGILEEILWDSTKIMSLASTGDWNPADRDFIIRHGREGYEAIAAKFGWKHMTTYSQKLLEYNSKEKIQQYYQVKFYEKLQELLKQHRSIARPQINELLDASPMTIGGYSQVNQLTDKINMGEITWEEYVAQINHVAKMYGNLTMPVPDPHKNSK